MTKKRTYICTWENLDQSTERETFRIEEPSTVKGEISVAIERGFYTFISYQKVEALTSGEAAMSITRFLFWDNRTTLSNSLGYKLK